MSHSERESVEWREESKRGREKKECFASSPHFGSLPSSREKKTKREKARESVSLPLFSLFSPTQCSSYPPRPPPAPPPSRPLAPAGPQALWGKASLLALLASHSSASSPSRWRSRGCSAWAPSRSSSTCHVRRKRERERERKNRRKRAREEGQSKKAMPSFDDDAAFFDLDLSSFASFFSFSLCPQRGREPER